MHYNLIYVDFDWYKNKIIELGDALPDEYKKGYQDSINNAKKCFEDIKCLLMEDIKYEICD
ncbi:hypothetical protein SCLARK_001310 [Spiroplasma clarkii]|nr:hypothetical protein [Spiroplasma clarkii]ARU91846.1 hypothetical protein SCLARK_001310 [Spiroplasma clarkii]